MSDPSVVALVPARAGSKRVPNKNVRLLAGHPLIAYTLSAARRSGVFNAVIVSTDSEETAGIARRYGAEIPCLRPSAIAGDTSPDIEWIVHMLSGLRDRGITYDAFSILRPTSPFRQSETIVRAWRRFRGLAGVDSLRAVDRCRQHPGKMWVVQDDRMKPLLSGGPEKPPWHSTPYQALPVIYVQNASLEIAWTRIVDEDGTIAGRVVAPFFTQGAEGFDINDRYDWLIAEEMIREGEAHLPEIALCAET